MPAVHHLFLTSLGEALRVNISVLQVTEANKGTADPEQ